MLNLSIEQFYHRISSRIALFSGFVNNKSIKKIIIACRLKPISIYTSSFNYREVKLDTIWVDEFAEKMIDLFRQKPYITNCTYTIPKISTDIFQNETVQFIINHSSKACIGFSKTNGDFILLLLGFDGYVRCYQYKNKELFLSSSLNAGLKILNYFIHDKSKIPIKKLLIKSELDEMSKRRWILINLPIKNLPIYIKSKKIKELFIK